MTGKGEVPNLVQPPSDVFVENLYLTPAFHASVRFRGITCSNCIIGGLQWVLYYVHNSPV